MMFSLCIFSRLRNRNCLRRSKLAVDPAHPPMPAYIRLEAARGIIRVYLDSEPAGLEYRRRLPVPATQMMNPWPCLSRLNTTLASAPFASLLVCYIFIQYIREIFDAMQRNQNYNHPGYQHDPVRFPLADPGRISLPSGGLHGRPHQSQ